MKRIPLTQGEFAIVDDEDFERVSANKWCFANGYAIRDEYFGYLNGKTLKKKIGMHRFVLGTPDGMETDHANHDTLDNRKSNLRVCTRIENQCNTRQKIGISGYRGVFKHFNKWIAKIQYKSSQKYIGLFNTPEEAAIARDKVAKKLHGEFAILNFPEGYNKKFL